MRILIPLILLLCGVARAQVPESVRWEAARSTERYDTLPRLDFYKMILYNRAYGLSNCIVNDGETSEALGKCEKHFLEEFRTFVSVSENVPYVKLASCYAKARLYGEEQKFRPYKSLKGDETYLLDLKKLEACAKTP